MFVAICVIGTLPLKTLTGSFVVTITYRFGIVLVVLYFVTFGLEDLRNRLAGAGTIYFDCVTLTVSVLFISIIYFGTGGNQSPYKILFLPTILFYTVRFGQKWGLAASTMTVVTLAAANISAFVQHKAFNLELDIVYIGVFFLTSWLVGSMVDMERAISDRLSRQVHIDELTGLYSHRYLQEELSRKIEEESASQFTLMVADIDYFRYYYETYGRRESDRLLAEVADNILGTAGGSGRVFRYGSDEFAVLVDHGDREKALSLAESIRGNIKRSFTIADPKKYIEYDLTASLGLSFYPADGPTVEKLAARAEQALLRAKAISGNKVETYFSVLDFLRAQVEPLERKALDKIAAFLAIINARDNYTHGHSERVLIYASIIAVLLGIPPRAKKHLQYGAYLHDIGKIEIDRFILNNPHALSSDQWKIIVQHPSWGADIARQIKALHPAVPAILYHHERYDGKGYPFKLKGKKIPLEGRIMAVADSFDAMTVERPYKKAMAYPEAIRELKKNRATQFDPDMVDLFTGFLGQYQSIEQLLDDEMKKKYLL
ncbi:MAG: diguanylate cyclase [Firmicutes bacterium]|nr:diguanylate cyclase [Bacillota bacterium]